MLSIAIIVIGAVATVVAWRAVALGLVSVWAAMGTVSGAAGTAALWTGWVSLSPGLDWPWAVIVGIGSGLALYVATRGFVLLARRWPVFDRHVEEIYDQRKGLSLLAALAIAAVVTATGEELFWRGLVQSRLASPLGWPGGTMAAWGAYVLANAASGSLPILAGALVSGAVWGALAWWTHGVLASLLCHSVWTGLMVTFPPGGQTRRSRPVSAARASS